LNAFISWRTATDSLLGNEAKEGKGNEGKADEVTGDDSHLARKTIGCDMSNKNILQAEQNRQHHNRIHHDYRVE
jgi:hypothetical protein